MVNGTRTGSPKFTAIVKIYQPLKGEPMITNIIRTSSLADDQGPKPGGWTPFGPLDAQARAVFAAATKRGDKGVYDLVKMGRSSYFAHGARQCR